MPAAGHGDGGSSPVRSRNASDPGQWPRPRRCGLREALHEPGAMPRALTQHAPVARSGSRAGRAGAPPALDLPAASGHHPPGSQPSQTTYTDVMKIRVVVHEAEEGGYWAEVPAIPGRAFPSEGCRGKAVVRLCAV